MTSEFIEFQADTLELAREQLQDFISDGKRLISEKVISDGKGSVSKQAVSEEIAFEQARNELPENAEVLAETVIEESLRELAIVESFDEKEAVDQLRQQAKKKYGVHGLVVNFKFHQAGSKGFAGMGKKPDRYEGEIVRKARVSISYKRTAIIRAEIGPPLSLEEKLAEALKSDSQEEVEAAVDKLHGMKTETLIDNFDLFLTPLLFAGWKHEKFVVNKRFSDKVVQLFEKIGPPAIAALLETSAGHYGMAKFACIALVRLANPAHAPEARAKLGAFIESGNQYAAGEAIDAMKVIGDQECVDYLRLIALKTNPIEQIRMKAAHALGVIGNKDAIPELTEAALNDPSLNNVRPIAHRALKQLNEEK